MYTESKYLREYHTDMTCKPQLLLFDLFINRRSLEVDSRVLMIQWSEETTRKAADVNLF